MIKFLRNVSSQVTLLTKCKWHIPNPPVRSWLVLIRAGSTKFIWNVPEGYKTDVKIFNSIAKTETPLILLNESIVKWYTCGPTVYDEAHMGHLSCYVRIDIIRRIMQRFFNLDVVLVMGMTDIDDKIIKRANESNLNISHLTKRYENEFLQDMKTFNILPPSMITRVTEHMPQIIDFVLRIINRKLAYVTSSGTVYFDTEEFGSYGRFINQEMENQQEAIDPDKKCPRDFALWKATKKDEPFWDSPWGKGRPGWHIECSAMASHVFGSQLDLHSGGIDLMFPHHENEECQSVAFHNLHQWSNYWLHPGHLHLKDDMKMSKSLKNTISVREFLKENTHNDFRMLCLMKPYRNNIELSNESLHAPNMSVKKLYNFLEDCDAYCKGFLAGGHIEENHYLTLLKECRIKIMEYLKDDFNTPKVLEMLFEMMNDVQKVLHSQPSNSPSRNVPVIVTYAKFMKDVFGDLGIKFQDDIANENESNLQETLDHFIKFRNHVRASALTSLAICKSGKYDSQIMKSQSQQLLKHCDDLRNNVLQTGIEIKDRGEESTWTYLKKV